MFRALIGVERESQLLDAAQPLKLRRVNKAHEQRPFGHVGAQADDVMHRVAVDAFRQLDFVLRYALTTTAYSEAAFVVMMKPLAVPDE